MANSSKTFLQNIQRCTSPLFHSEKVRLEILSMKAIFDNCTMLQSIPDHINIHDSIFRIVLYIQFERPWHALIYKDEKTQKKAALKVDFFMTWGMVHGKNIKCNT